MTYQTRLGLAILSAGLLSAASPARVESSGEGEPLKKLMDGNKRYLDIKYAHPHQTKYRRDLIAKGQHPFAIVLSCSDSQVPPEVIFDRGLGDLFVVRVAGNIADDAVIGSIEYAAEHLHVPLLMVLGHERCGAVDATVKGGKIPGHISSLTKAIGPAVERVKGKPGDPVDSAVRANVEMVVEQLKTSKPILAELIHEGKLKVAGARYDLDTGVVELLTGANSKSAASDTAETSHRVTAHPVVSTPDHHEDKSKAAASAAPKPIEAAQPSHAAPASHAAPPSHKVTTQPVLSLPDDDDKPKAAAPAVPKAKH